MTQLNMSLITTKHVQKRKSRNFHIHKVEGLMYRLKFTPSVYKYNRRDKGKREDDEQNHEILSPEKLHDFTLILKE